MDTILPIKRIHHVEFIVGNALQAAYFYRKTFGFTQTGYLGPETGHPGCASYVLEQRVSRHQVPAVYPAPQTPENPPPCFRREKPGTGQDPAVVQR